MLITITIWKGIKDIDTSFQTVNKKNRAPIRISTK